MIGKALKKLRGKKTQEIISQGIGISRARYSHYENDYVQPDNEMLKKIAEFYEVTPNDLLGVSEDTVKELSEGEKKAYLFVKEMSETYNLKNFEEFEDRFKLAYEIIDKSVKKD